MSVDSVAAGKIDEARRQVEICNACRYCEGYCAVFPAINRQRAFAEGDITQLANLCHNCRGCYYACQYTEPHEFRINIPAILSEVRINSWERFIMPGRLATVFQHHGVVLAGCLVGSLALIFMLIGLQGSPGGEGFYATLSHAIMIAVFTPSFVAPLLIVGWALRAYWKHVGGESIRLAHIASACKNAATLKNLSGGQGQGCNFEKGDRFSQTRLILHQCAFWGFVLCFASTSVATIMHYMLDMPAPYKLISLPKLFGLSGGVLLVAGCAGLALLKLKAEKSLGATSAWGGEMAFVLLLGTTGLTGLILYAATGSDWVAPLLAVHLGTVLTFFVTLPYTKMVHGFFRLAALVREAQLATKLSNS